MIDEATYADYRARVDAFEAFIKQHGLAGEAYASIAGLDVPPRPTNEMRSAVEVFELHRDKPQKFTAYVDDALLDAPVRPPGSAYDVQGEITDHWACATLGKYRVVTHWLDRHGNRRYSIRVWADWGGEYVGQTQGAGMYVNLRRVKV